MTDDQVESLIDKAYTILDYIQYGEEEVVDTTSQLDPDE
jgi:hypothetical protein